MEAYPHLRIEREQPINQRRPGGPPRTKPPADIAEHGRHLHETFVSARDSAFEDIGGFDNRRLFKLRIEGLSPDAIEKIPGVELISEEDGGYALAFANEQALEVFEARLSTLAKGELPKRKEILYALQAFDHWTPGDRTGWALKRDGMPTEKRFVLDVELWPLSRQDARTRLRTSFEKWLMDQGIAKLDRIDIDSLLLYRVSLNAKQAEKVLQHRDVRTVDLPPRYSLERHILETDIQDISPVQPPPENAPVVAVLDSGIAGGHPLISPALGDAQGFLLPDKAHEDSAGHGTHVAGIALYGDIEECARAKSFVPQLRIVSGRVLDDDAKGDTRLIENIVSESVRYFYDEYGCRIFNLSYGDTNKPYLGGHVRGLACILDQLSRELGVLFIVPTGNFTGTEHIPSDWKDDYPNYLFTEEARLLDPAPALNALTVGSLARWDQSSHAQRYKNDPREIPIAQRDQPSPFTCCGSSVKGAIKPEVVAYGGNWAIHQFTKAMNRKTLGELSLSKDFAVQGRLLTEDSGTSYAAPHVAHYAGRLLNELPKNSINLIRTLLVANADVPLATVDLFNGDQEKIVQSAGYGMIQVDTLFRSTEEEVTLIAEAFVPNKHHHFYEIPVPASFYNSGKGRRRREITVALAHCPVVRTTRVDYKASSFQFRLVEADTLGRVIDTFNIATTKDDFPNIPELNVNQTCKNQNRSKGTVQCCTWTIKQPRQKNLFVVVTRKDPAWGESLSLEEEPYALVIKLKDRENEEARLYTEIQAQLQVRERARQRLRI
jgi:hypothetical protein